MRNILLIEPNYKNKYPPMGLMKIATYHRKLGDKVKFFKGDLKDLVIDDITNDCVNKLLFINSEIPWMEHKVFIFEYIKNRRSEYISELLDNDTLRYKSLIEDCLKEAKDKYWKKKWENEPKYDRVYVTTLFTFYWKRTIDTINFAKKLVKNISELKVGGIMSTVLTDDVVIATGITPIRGLLDRVGMLDKGNDMIIDNLPLDYSILKEVDYQYPEMNAYYGYMTRGCIRNCSFCAVPTLEPQYADYISITGKINQTIEHFGEQRNLLLLDNNVLASPRFADIIEEIKAAGFESGATYIEPDQLQISLENLKRGINDKAYLKDIHSIIVKMLSKIKGEEEQMLFNRLDELKLLKVETCSKDAILKIEPIISILYSKYFKRTPRQRFVDFNQGVDARLINEENIKLLSQIAIRPLRIAFDSMAYEKPYKKAVQLAVDHGIKHLSNYLLYNEKDKPVDLYKRLKINVDICEDHKDKGVNVYSFPMKFHPIIGEQRFSRDYMGQYWNRKFIRAVQAVLNATKGKIGKGKQFFEKAFGKDETEFEKILYMPETYILYRLFFENEKLTDKWWNAFDNLIESEKEEAKHIIEQNKFTNIESLTNNPNILKVLKHYTITRDDVVKTKGVGYELKLNIPNPEII